MAVALIIIVLIFIICHAFKFAINLVEFLDMYLSMFGIFSNHLMKQLHSKFCLDPRETYWGSFMDISVSISHLLVVFNCSVNFIIYCFKDNTFRKSFRNLFVISDKSNLVRPKVTRLETVVEQEEWEQDEATL